MIDWLTIKPLAQEVIRDLSGCKVVWQEESQGTTWEKDPIVYLRISSLVQFGTPAEVRQDDPHGIVDSTVIVSAQKRFTLSLRAESFDQDLEDGKHAGDILERVKTRLKRSSTIERLRGVFCVLQELGANSFTYRNQNRIVSCYTLDLLCGTVDNDIDDAVNAGGFIDEIRATSHFVRGPDGNPTKTQVNVDARRGA